MSPDGPDLLSDEIRVDDLLAHYSPEELALAAESYLSRLRDHTYHLAKPLASIDEAATMLGHFAALVSVLDLAPGYVVLDFGAGSCWTSRMLTQLGCAVIACDVSPSALAIGRELYERLPPIGNVPAPRFLPFDGHRFDLEDASVDRIACMDAFHHVANPHEVLVEMYRICKPGAIVAFAEPGPLHSRTPQAQSEMRHFKVVERDIVVEQIDIEAREIGFAGTAVAIYNSIPVLVPAAEFGEVLANRPDVSADATRAFLTNHRLVVLRMPGTSVAESNRRGGLRGEVTILSLEQGHGRARVTNSSTLRWLPPGSSVGTVNLGVHLYAANGDLLDLDFHRIALSDGRAIEPAELLEIEFDLPSPPAPGRYRVEFDLVAEQVAWFADNGNPTVTVDIVEP
jgi:SAM-dependent methyltransferase